MARKLKTYQTSLGFFEQAIAAPSMKAALEAWGADSNLFHQGAAKESRDPDVIAATMAKPGVVLKRPVGSDGSFGEHAELPRNLDQDGRKKPAHKPSAKVKKSSAQPDKAATGRQLKRTNGSVSVASARKPGKRQLGKSGASAGIRPSTRRKPGALQRPLPDEKSHIVAAKAAAWRERSSSLSCRRLVRGVLAPFLQDGKSGGVGIAAIKTVDCLPV
jgi:hypothetical protein